MADVSKTDEQSGSANPYLQLIAEDLDNIQKWSAIDQEVLKKRLCERRKNRTKPYKGAPNFVVPIIDDNIREKTDQEFTMLANAPLIAQFIALSSDVKDADMAKAEAAFDTYVRHVMQIMPDIDLALDMRNARGFAVVKTTRRMNEYIGKKAPAIEIRDPADVIVPSQTRKIQDAVRIADVYRYSVEEFRDLAQASKWKNEDEIAEQAQLGSAAGSKTSNEPQSMFETIKHLIGVDDTGKGNATVVLFEYWHTAGNYTVEKAMEIYGAGSDEAAKIIKGRRCCMVFSPQLPDKPAAIVPWREVDETCGADPETGCEMTKPGADRPWPYRQIRYENRSQFYYDTRGAAQLVMDDQIAASQTRNAKHVLMDFMQQPYYTGTTSNTTQVTHEPGSILPEGLMPVPMQNIPQTFDFSVEQFKREAASRVGAKGGYEFSGDLSSRKRVQKTATEIEATDLRGDMVSAASVERFSWPWTAVFTELFRDCARLKLDLPILTAGKFTGMASMGQSWASKVLVVPAASAKTLNPDQQFRRNAAVWGAVAPLMQAGVVFDPVAVARDLLTHWDPFRAGRWLPEALNKAGTGQVPAQQPVYVQIQQIAHALETIKQATDATGKLAMEDSQKIDALNAAVEKIVHVLDGAGVGGPGGAPGGGGMPPPGMMPPGGMPPGMPPPGGIPGMVAGMQ